MADDQSITSDQMRRHLREAFASDAEENLIWHLAQKTKDPLKPEDSKRKRRHPMLILYIVLILVVLAAFLYFGVFRP
jgi:hypothetical protein